jgi:hypothetical protein
MFGQLWVVDPLDGLGAGDGEAAKTGEAATKAAIAATATINARISRRDDLRGGAGGGLSAAAAGNGSVCLSFSSIGMSSPAEGISWSVPGRAWTSL